MTGMSAPEPAPDVNAEGDVWRTIIDDMEERREFGLSKYGVPVRAFNGRRPVIDRYQELLDGLVYARQDIIEREQLAAELRGIAKDATLYGEHALSERIERVADRMWPQP